MNASYHLLRDLLALVLLASGGGKLADLNRSAVLLLRLGVTSKPTAERMTFLLAATEIAVALAIFSGQLLMLVDVLALTLFVGFLAVMGYATRVAGGTRCRCFGALSSAAVGREGVLRNFGFVAVSAAVLLVHTSASSVDEPPAVWSLPLMLMAGLFTCACAVAARSLDRAREVRG